MYKMLYYLMELYEETPEELQPYLLSFIKNETFGVPVRIDAILKSLKDATYTPVFPKRNYVFTEEIPTIIEKETIEDTKVVPIDQSKPKRKTGKKRVANTHESENLKLIK